MQAAEIDEQFPVVGIDSPALEAARMLAEHSLPGIVVLAPDGRLDRTGIARRHIARTHASRCASVARLTQQGLGLGTDGDGTMTGAAITMKLAPQARTDG